MQQALSHLEAIDPLMRAHDFAILDEQLRGEHDKHIRALFGEFVEDRRRAGEGASPYGRSGAFNRLRQEVVFSISDGGVQHK
jgi:hypothetical protein